MIQDYNIDKIIKQLPDVSLDHLEKMYQNYCYERDFMGLSVPQKLLTALLKEIEAKKKPSPTKLIGKAAEVQKQEEMRKAAWEERKKELSENPIDENERLRGLLHQAEAKNYNMEQEWKNERRITDMRWHDDLKEAVQRELDSRKEGQQTEAPKETIIPDCLNTREAKKYWKRLQKAGYVDEHWQRTKKCSRRISAYIAKKMADVLGITVYWKSFEKLWNIKNLAQEKYKMKELYNYPKRKDEIDEIFYE